MSKENKPLKAIDADFVSLELDRLELNEGQLDGLPANPREILETKLDLLKKDIQAYPELMKYRMLLVYPLDNGKYIIIGGNMRYRALLDLGYKDAPCVIIPKETSIEKAIYVDLAFIHRQIEAPCGQSIGVPFVRQHRPLPPTEAGVIEIDVDSFFDKLDKEAEKDKGEKITVSIPDEYADQKEEIKSRIEATLMGEFEGIKIK